MGTKSHSLRCVLAGSRRYWYITAARAGRQICCQARRGAIEASIS